ncbi:MAG: MBL fold metallo-hydrolase [Methylibium sp.]|uniref:MBL fold metallo-hydrolase n=1 Tax=Methylibium sp. TaxID=2067992 RepID=UPI0018492815|nr:MBL fold metallo-hydrolase [Methylibium sp.]MBA3598215.1 MBL fold metallo-hydrolase [Methylibium sp.]
MNIERSVLSGLAKRLVLGWVAALQMVALHAAPHDDPIVVAPGVYAWIGGTEEAAPENAGVIGNSGFIVGHSGTTVVNTGSSYAHGKRLIAAAERIGGKPVLLAIMTQPLQEFVMGSAAFAERGIPVLAHEASARLVKARCDTCLKNLRGILGEEVMQGTHVLVPTQTISATQTREVGGRKLLLWHGGWGVTPGDLAVIDVTTGVVFSGALVSVRRIPELRDANPAGWREALAAFKALPITKLVPGYGPVADLNAIAAQRGYFDALEHHAADLLNDGASLLEASERADLPAYADWDFYAKAHPRNLQQTYLRLEAAGFGR